jgi:hypothetical protein
MINPEYFVNAFKNGWTATFLAGKVTFQCLEVGELLVTSGHVAACDAFVADNADFFVPIIPCGKYQVTLSLEEDEEGRKAIALARLKIRRQSPVRWELAEHPKRCFALLQNNKYPGYPVDSGTGCFIDGANLQLLASQLNDPDQFDRILYGNNSDNPYWMWQTIVLDQLSGANVVMFKTGYGDGWYASYYGYDEQGNLAEIITECIGEEDRV